MKLTLAEIRFRLYVTNLISLEQNPMSRTAQGDSLVQNGETVADFFGQVPCLAGLQPATVDRLAEFSRLVHVPESEEVCREGDGAGSLLILLAGQTALSGAAANGSRAVVEVIRPVAPIQLATVLARLNYPSTAT